MDIALDVIFIAPLTNHLLSLNFQWQENAYASAYWTLVVTHLVFAVITVLETLYVLVLAFRGFYNSERHWAIEIDGLSSYFLIAVWIAVFATVFISPYLMQ